MRRKSGLVTHDSIIILLLSIPLLLGQWSCAHVPKSPSEEMRARFGTIGIVSAPSNPKIQFYPEFAKGRLSGAGKGFSMGLGVGALYGAVLGATTSTPTGGLLAPFLIAGGAAIGGITGGVTGGIAGAVNAVPKGEAQKIETSIKSALDEKSIQKTMTASVFKNSLELPNSTFVLIEEDNMAISTAYNFNHLRERGIDTILELNVKSGGFKEGKGKNPLIAFYMKVDTRLIRTMDGEEIFSREFEYQSLRHHFADWLDNGLYLLRNEVEHCFNELSREIVEELFIKRLS